jgi:hypothetical protein
MAVEKKSKFWEPFWSYKLIKTHCQRGKTAFRILIFSITMNADDSINVKFIATYSPIFYVYSISVLAMVRIKLTFFLKWHSPEHFVCFRVNA